MLTSVTSVPGVRGVALFDSVNTCVAHALRPPYEPILLSEVADRLVEAETGFEGAGLASPDFLAVKFEQGCVVVVKENEIRSVVLCDQKINLAMLRVALRVVSLKAKKSKSAPPAEHPGGPSMQQPGWNPEPGGNFQPGASHSNHWNAAPAGMSPAGASQSFEMANHGGMVGHPHAASHSPVGAGRQALYGGQDPSTSRQPPDSGFRPGASNHGRSVRRGDMSWGERSRTPGGNRPGSVGIKVMKHVLRALTDQVGDAAQGIMERELLALRATPRSLTVAQFADLIHGVARRIEDPERRKKFLEKALGDRE